MVDCESADRGNTTTMVLRLRCVNIVDVGGPSQTDPFIMVYSGGSRQKHWQVIGHTELIWNSLNPAFCTPFLLDYDFSVQHFLKFELYHGKQEENPMHRAKLLGEARCSVGEIVGNKCQLSKFFMLPTSKRNKGLLIMSLEEYSENTETIQLQVSANGLKGSSSLRPYFQIIKVVGDTSKSPVLTSAPAKGTTCQWPVCEIGKNYLCNNDNDLPLTIEVYHYRKRSEDKFIGVTQLSYSDLFEDGRTKFPLRKEIGSPELRGEIVFSNLGRTPQYGFLDYVRGGCEISLVGGVDFTRSNGALSDPQSLHALCMDAFNPYERALHSVGEILVNYDSDQLVPMYGFGGKIGGLIQHCFPINNCPENPNVKGVNGMLVEYRRALSHVELCGPTLFHPIIRTVVLEAEAAQKRRKSQQYFVLLILTDGSFDDEFETKEWIVRGSKTPMSIVIIGIGDVVNFEALEKIDKEPIKNSQGETMARDIVKFVHYDKVAHSQTKLRSEVLEEIPGALVEYFAKLNGIPPNPPPRFSLYKPEAAFVAESNAAAITPQMIQAQVDGTWVPEGDSTEAESPERASVRVHHEPPDEWSPQRHRMSHQIRRKQTHS